MTDEHGLTEDDAAAIDRYVAQLAREEEEDIERKHGQEILEIATGQRQARSEDPLFEALNEAWRASLAKPERENAEDNQQ